MLGQMSVVMLSSVTSQRSTHFQVKLEYFLMPSRVPLEQLSKQHMVLLFYIDTVVENADFLTQAALKTNSLVCFRITMEMKSW